MIIVKITILLILITVVYRKFWTAWVKSNPEEMFKMTFSRSYIHKGAYPLFILMIIDIIGVFASAIYLLFIR